MATSKFKIYLRSGATIEGEIPNHRREVLTLLVKEDTVGFITLNNINQGDDTLDVKAEEVVAVFLGYPRY